MDALTHPSHHPLASQGLPSLAVSNEMRSAAASIAACYQAHQQACHALPAAKAKGSIQQNLTSQRETKSAYHLALKFLSAATLKANPLYSSARFAELSAAQQKEWKEVVYRYLDRQLNQLIAEQLPRVGEVHYTHADHPVMLGPW